MLTVRYIGSYHVQHNYQAFLHSAFSVIMASVDFDMLMGVNTGSNEFKFMQPVL